MLVLVFSKGEFMESPFPRKFTCWTSQGVRRGNGNLPTHHEGAASPCALCRCTNTVGSDMPMTDVNEDARWMGNVWTDDAWTAHHAHRTVHSAFDPAVVPAAGITNFWPDWMHCKHLGTDQYLLGSVLLWLVNRSLPYVAVT